VKQRSLGEAAKTQETSNFRNTIGCLKRLIGRTASDNEIEYEKQFLNANLIDVDGSVGAEVRLMLYTCPARDLSQLRLKR
jgi:heat shock 70kDa protein 4